MCKLSIYGHSDDCFELEGDFNGENEFGCYCRKVILRVEVSSPRAGLIVSGEYGVHNGVWTIGVEPLDEDIPLPYAKFGMADNGYSPRLFLEFNDKPTVTRIDE